jgi:hypothetical protein
MIPILLSYHYFKRTDLGALVDAHGGPGAIDVFADSGAFSALNAGALIRVKDYAAWLVEHRRVINFAAALDVIGDPDATARNLAELEAAVGGMVTIVPTFHVGSPWRYLDDIMSSHKLIALGGAVGVNGRAKALMPWLVRCHRAMRDAGVVAHGFGLTRPPYPETLPWYSVDSSYWGSAGRTGSLGLWDRRTRQFVKMRVGRPIGRDARRIVRDYGLDPAEVATTGFGVVGMRGPQGAVDRRAMNLASVRSLKRYAEHVGRLRSVPPPGRVRGDGTKVYLAAGSATDFRLLATTTTDPIGART